MSREEKAVILGEVMQNAGLLAIPGK